MRPHWPSVRGRARADRGALLLCAAVVALVTALAGAAPVLLAGIADDAVRDAVLRAGDDADVTATTRWEPDAGPKGRFRAPGLADDVDVLRLRALGELEPALRAVLAPPVASVVSPTLRVVREDRARTFRMAYLTAGGEPAVTWLAGGAPGPAVAAQGDAEVPYQTAWLVRVGVSESTAAALGVRPGDRIPLTDERGAPKLVEVSGVFRATDRADPRWRPAPWLLEPDPGTDRTRTVRLGGLLSRDSLPDARLAFDADELRPTVTLAPRPEAFTLDVGHTVGAAAVALEAGSAAPSAPGTRLAWNTRLDTVLHDVAGDIEAASVQMSVLLTGVVAVAVLVLTLVADLLVSRRVPALVLARHRGAALPALGAELLLESAVTAAVAAAAGLAAARAVGPAVAWAWTVPVVLAAAVGPPVLGVRAAGRATDDRPAPANRAAGQFTASTGHLRRLVLEGTVLTVAAAAFVALRQRGVDPGGGTALPASAPTLGALAGGLLLARLLPPGTRLLLRQALRSRHPVAVFGVARAASTAGRGLPVVTLAAAAALASFVLTVGATVEAGIRDTAWRTVGADARLDLGADAGVDFSAATADGPARRIAAAPGVRHVVTAQVSDAVQVATAEVVVTTRLVAVDADGYGRMLADTPLPGTLPAGRLAAPAGDAVPALVRSADGSLRPGMRLELRRAGQPPIPLVAVGAAPAVGAASTVGGPGDVVLVDAATLTAAGMPVAPNTIWVSGPGAERAAAGAGAGHAVLRTGVVRSLHGAPLVSGLLNLAAASVLTLVALGLLGLALGAAVQAPQRWLTISRLRTLGLRPRDAGRVAAGELLPAVAFAGLTGPLLGVLLAGATLRPLSLPRVTGQATDPVLTPPWLLLGGLPLLFLVTVAVGVGVESARRRRGRLAAALRIGER
ncbi:ABC transporter permease [Dactylosporangium aurantiacum]|uniref:ABC transporter permease n=1 Tax=Dactylosporangium aurantiacum TaxID=35754 RepID=A0A9Q9I869_9ACTN|nr:FtsX-like permease family protein [Dactylosporangium aurantiacum]MDG6108763.1 ABC transporter permease [Dactylosporangium aurantiacum]UWZ51122.1 ABC transporter permease [Dactylosporangium aurantiacum]